MTPAELSEKLWDNAERVAKYLLPKGHLEGKEWCVGNTNGDAGKSLKINIGGKKRGQTSPAATVVICLICGCWYATASCMMRCVRQKNFSV